MFVRDSGINYCTERHQTLRDYGVRFGECPPRVKIDRLTVRVEKTLDFRFFLRGGWPFLIIAQVTFGYRAIRLTVVQRSNLNLPSLKQLPSVATSEFEDASKAAGPDSIADDSL